MDFAEIARLTIEELDALPHVPYRTDMRSVEPGRSGQYFCRANANGETKRERGCKHYSPTLATCPGEVPECIYKGEEYPLSGYTYCLLAPRA